LAKNPDARFQTAREFARALQRAAEGKTAIQPDPAATLIVSPQPAQASSSYGPSAHQSNPTLKSGEMELEFWRSIKDSNDANDYDAYVRQFPQGVYVTLAMRKIAKLRGLPPAGSAEDSGLRTMEGTDRTRLLRPEAAVQRPATERAGTGANKTARFADTPPEGVAGKKTPLLIGGVVGVLALAGAAAYFAMSRSPQPPVATTPKVQTDGTDKREAAEKAKAAEAQAKQEAEARAKQEAEARAKQEAEARAKQEAEARAKRETEAKAKTASKAQAKRDAELKAQREAEARAQREAEARAQREAQARAQREAEAKAQREAEARARREAEAKAQQPKTKAQRDAEAKAQREAEAKAKREAEAREKARLEQERREKQAAERAKQEAERKNDSGKTKSIVVPTF
jgi:hypothetical protein